MSRFGPDGKRKDIYSPEYHELRKRKSAERERLRLERAAAYDGPPPEPKSEEELRVQRWVVERDNKVAIDWNEGVKSGRLSPFAQPVISGNMSASLREYMSEDRHQHLRGLVVGAAVGDALGAPFEFGPAGAFRERFPAGSTVNEMVGGGLWEPGEFTDDTQMAILEAESILACGGLDRSDLFNRFQGWVRSGPKDVGISTRAVLSDPAGWPDAPANYFRQHPNGAAGNGSLMRASFVASRWATGNFEGSAEIGRYFSTVTHGDPAAGEGRALFQMMCQVASMFADPFEDIDSRLAYLKVGLRAPFEQVVADPAAGLPNGTVWGCFRDAYWAVKQSDSFEEAMYNACNVGGDVDTVAAVAGGLAGVCYGLDEIPERWIEPLHGTIGAKSYSAVDLIELSDKLRFLEIPRSSLWEYHYSDRSELPTSTKPPIWRDHK